MIKFPTPESGLASPINRLDSGFVGGGRTAGGAREFVIPNGPKLQPDETDVMGRWIETRDGVRADDTCGRIDWLVNEVLEEVAVSPEWGAWEVLYRDPSDGRYWERTYPEGNMQGGGPPRLRCISLEEARAKYRI